MKNCVSISWLKAQLKDEDLLILDSSLPKQQAKLTTALQGLKIPGARYFDLSKAFSDSDSLYPNSFPSPQQFEKAAQKLGIMKHHRIVVYDNPGIFSSPRVWWLFKMMGHEQVAVLDGGLPHWVEAGGATAPITEKQYPKGDFTAQLTTPEKIKDIEFIHSNIEKEEVVVVDARAQGRFLGTSPEPRQGLPSGSIPKSINLPYQTLLENNQFKSTTELEAIFQPLQTINKPLVFSCGSGVTACILLLASQGILKQEKAIYDGSWTEWASTYLLKD